MQFKQTLYSLGSSLAAGRSVENSFKEVAKDLRLLYPDPVQISFANLILSTFGLKMESPLKRHCWIYLSVLI